MAQVLIVITISIILLEAFKDFGNIFSINNIKYFTLHKDHDYTINLFHL